jgi:hypothetical protein
MPVITGGNLVGSGLGQPLLNAGAPVNNTTFVGVAVVGSLLIDTVNGKLHLHRDQWHHHGHMDSGGHRAMTSRSFESWVDVELSNAELERHPGSEAALGSALVERLRATLPYPPIR